MRKYGLVLALMCALAAWPLVAQMAEPVDYDAIVKIKQEGLGVRTQQNPAGSQVMEIMSYLTDVHGPRLTGSPNIKAAGEWSRGKLAEWGLVNAKLEPWGPFGRGWANERFSAHVIAPTPYPLIGYPRAWTPGTDGPVTGEAVLVVIEREEDLAKFKGKLKGKFVFSQPIREVRAAFDPLAQRYTDAQLDELAQQTVAVSRRAGQPQGFGQAQQLNQLRQRFFTEEGVAAWVEAGTGDGGTVFVGGGGSRQPNQNPGPPRVALAVEHYNRILRTLEKNIPVTLEMNIQNKWYDADLNSFNVVAEIPGTDKADELVMLGAHFDSWHAGTGATDNAAGCAVMMEAVRILKATGLKMRRTVRIGLWTGEEQGLLGSRAYIREHFADVDAKDPNNRKWIFKPEHAKFSGYFNVDNGTGKIRGVYLQGNEAIRSMFEQWMKPFHGLGMTTLTIRNTGGTDHLAYDAVGLPGFQFIQDEVEYDTRTHHSNMDVYDRIQEADMKQMATIVASFVYLAANRPEKLPRKPMPPPPAPRPQFGQ